MNYPVADKRMSEVGLSGDGNHRLPSAKAGDTVQCDGGFVVEWGLLTAIQLSGKVTQEISSP